MIYDHIKNTAWYAGASARLAAGLRFLADTDCRELVTGRHDIDGDDLFVLIQDYTTKPHEQGVWEAHRKFIDIQYIVSGNELIGCAPEHNLTISQPYDADKDCTFYANTRRYHTIYLPMAPGNFAVFAPHDAHMPGLLADTPAAVRKAVVKVRIHTEL